jgi:hypothetical protein
MLKSSNLAQKIWKLARDLPFGVSCCQKKSFKWFWESWHTICWTFLDLENFEPFKFWTPLNFIEFSVFRTLTISNWKVMNTKNSQLIRIYKVHLGHFYILHHLVLKESCFQLSFFRIQNLNCSNFYTWRDDQSQHHKLIEHDFISI